MKRLVSLFLGVILVLMSISFFPGCKDPNKDDFDFPLYDLSYNSHIRPLLFRDCTYSGCHNTDTKSAGIDFERPFLTTDDYEIQRPGWFFPLITTGDPNLSMLYIVIADPNEDPLVKNMPPIESNYSPLTKKEKVAIQTWIEEGADIYN